MNEKMTSVHCYIKYTEAQRSMAFGDPGLQFSE